jgi:hypothetical protein
MSSKLQTAVSRLKNTCWNSLQILVLFDEQGEEIPPSYMQLEQGQKWKHSASRKRTGAELGWRQYTGTVNSHAFSGLPAINFIWGITEDSCPFEFFCVFFVIMKFSKI